MPVGVVLVALVNLPAWPFVPSCLRGGGPHDPPGEVVSVFRTTG